jgi:hypothetical protein
MASRRARASRATSINLSGVRNELRRVRAVLKEQLKTARSERRKEALDIKIKFVNDLLPKCFCRSFRPPPV